jgi:hypothetical protein
VTGDRGQGDKELREVRKCKSKFFPIFPISSSPALPLSPSSNCRMVMLKSKKLPLNLLQNVCKEDKG